MAVRLSAAKLDAGLNGTCFQNNLEEGDTTAEGTSVVISWRGLYLSELDALNCAQPFVGL
jgi:hypothetical protein